MTIGYGDFDTVDIRVGIIVVADSFPETRKPACTLQIDFGAEIGIEKSSAQVTRHDTRKAHVGRQVAAVVNFGPK